jgi:hypothetical protein
MTKRVFVALLVGAIGLSLSSGLVAQQNVTIEIGQSLYLDCVPPDQPGDIYYVITQADIEAPQPIDIGDWGLQRGRRDPVQTELAVHIVLGALCRERRHLRLHG